jgi:hypothetical protein
MTVTRLSSRRWPEDIRTWWPDHVQAQRDSGQTQAAQLPGSRPGSEVLHPVEAKAARHTRRGRAR